MNEDECIGEYSGRIRDVTNQAYQLGKIYIKEETVRKVIGTIPKIFEPKVAAIDLYKDYNLSKWTNLLESFKFGRCLTMRVTSGENFL